MLKNIVPGIIDKTLHIKTFNLNLIKESLLLETELCEESAIFITNETCRFIIGITGERNGLGIKYITAPMIREIVCVMLLKHGFEKERLQYTRIGLPHYDLELLFKKPKQEGDRELVQHIREEGYNVNNIIYDLNVKKEDMKDENKK